MFGGGFMWIVWILLIVLLVWVIRAAAGGGSSGSSPPPPSETPLDILKKRYARGEIDDEEFERRRRELES